MLRRTADDDDPYERPIVANADQLVIVTALADPPPRTGMIDRILVAGFDAGIDPLLCLTKADLASPDDLVARTSRWASRSRSTSPDSDLDAVRAALAGHRSVFVGHSGVGKSTLVNALIPGAKRAIGEVNEVTGRGRHTSTSAIALRLPPIRRQGGRVRRLRLGDRHPGRPVVRAQPRQPGPDHRRVRRPGRDHRGLPPRLHPRGGRTGVRAGRRRRTRRTESRAAGVVSPDARLRPVA